MDACNLDAPEGHTIHHRKSHQRIANSEFRSDFISKMNPIERSANKTKCEYLKERINAANSDGRFGKWSWAVSFRISDIEDIIKKHSNQTAAHASSRIPSKTIK